MTPCTIKPLEWQRREPNVAVAETPLGTVCAEYYPARSAATWWYANVAGCAADLDAAQAAAEAHWQERIKSALVETTNSSSP